MRRAELATPNHLHLSRRQALRGPHWIRIMFSLQNLPRCSVQRRPTPEHLAMWAHLGMMTAEALAAQKQPWRRGVTQVK